MTWLVAHLAFVAGSALALFASVHLLRQRRAPQATLAWLLAILFVPYVALPLYLALGTRKERLAAQKPDLWLPEAVALPEAEAPPLDRLLRRYGLPGATRGNRVALCGTGEDAFAALLVLTEAAERALWATLYILADDAVGQAFLEALARRAAAGVDVRLLLDGFGSRPLPDRALAPLREAGGRVARFLPVLHLPFRGHANLRNHRKLVLADERRVLAGGMNVAAEYMGPTPTADRWRDLAFVLEGPAVAGYAALFRSDWAFASRVPLPSPMNVPEAAGDAVAQVVPAGPDVAEDALYDAVLSACFAAGERLWAVTPYFVPDEALARALELAARRGVDVRLVVPDRSNHPLADFARGAALRALAEAGAAVLRYPLGMVHAKALVADDVAFVGSANLDFRSLFLNFESALVLYGAPEVAAVAAWIERLGEASVRGVAPTGALRETAEGVARLAAPLL